MSQATPRKSPKRTLRRRTPARGEAEDGMACYLIGCAMDELRSQDWLRDEKVIPLVPRKSLILAA